jgi:hypothetical protein
LGRSATGRKKKISHHQVGVGHTKRMYRERVVRIIEILFRKVKIVLKLIHSYITPITFFPCSAAT